tara:strand:- start:8695 stop:8799 length:105 start_codon:yes stop_codon:yes gene_type:complete
VGFQLSAAKAIRQRVDLDLDLGLAGLVVSLCRLA